MTGRNGHRKRRNDRNHIVYRLVCEKTGDTYIGITVVSGRAFKKSLATRWQKHVYHATVEQRPYRLQESIRKHGPEAFSHEIISIVRGKASAHETEKALVQKFKPTLNTELTSRKCSRWD